MHKRVPFLLLAVAVAAGVAFTWALGLIGAHHENGKLASLAATAAAALNPEKVAELHGDARDAGGAVHSELRENLQRVRARNPELRFVYLMRQQGDAFIFLADGEPENSEDYSPPGQVYTEQVEGLRQVLATGRPLVEAPYRDRWGEWVSALAPLTITDDNRVVAILGMDINAGHWQASVMGYRLFGTLVSAVLVGMLGLFLLLYQRQSRIGQAQIQKTQRLQTELAAHRDLEQRLSQLAFVDALTGIANRRVFDETLLREWSRATRDQLPLSLIMADLDFFKRYNDHYGHLDGDDCLRKVAEVLKNCTGRDTDLVARYGGEEFGFILPNTDAATAQIVAERVRSAVQARAIPHADSDVARVLTICAGHATVMPSDALIPRDLVMHADKALYAAKRAGRNAVRGAVQE